MSNDNVIDFTGSTILPITGASVLRKLADEIEKLDNVQTVVVIMEGKPAGVDIAATHADMERIMSITQAGLDLMRSQYLHNVNNKGRN